MDALGNPIEIMLTAGNVHDVVVAEHNPDIVLLNLSFPDIDGVEIISRISMWSHVPIIVIFARSEDADKIGKL